MSDKLIGSARQISIAILTVGALSIYLWITISHTEAVRAEFHRLELTFAALRTIQRDPLFTNVTSGATQRLSLTRSLRLHSDPGTACEILVASASPGRKVLEHWTIRDKPHPVAGGQDFLVISFDYTCKFYVDGFPGGSPPAAMLLFRDSATDPWWVTLYSQELDRFEPSNQGYRTQIVFTKFDPEDFHHSTLSNTVNIAKLIEELLANSTTLPYERLDAFLRAKIQKATGKTYENGDEAVKDILVAAETKPSLMGVAINQEIFQLSIPFALISLSFAFWHRTRRLAASSDPPLEPWVLLLPDGLVEKTSALIVAFAIICSVAAGFLAGLQRPGSETYSHVLYLVTYDGFHTLRGYWDNIRAITGSRAMVAFMCTAIGLVFILLALFEINRINHLVKKTEVAAQGPGRSNENVLKCEDEPPRLADQ